MKKIFIVLMLLCLPLGRVNALSPEQKRVIQSGANYFDVERDCVNGPITDPTDTPCACTISVSTNLSGNDNMERTYNYLTVQKGLTPVQAAGLMGNIQQESSFNPKLEETGDWGGKHWGGESDTIPPAVGPQGQPGYGIVQWTSSGRKQGLGALASSSSPQRPVYDLGLQLDFMWSELEGPYKASSLDPLKQETDLARATKIIQDNYEVGADTEVRFSNAQKILKLYGGNTGATTVAASSQPSGDCSSITGPGQDSQYVDGFLVYSQYDAKWKDKPYSTSTIGESGCGPAAMAMIITALTKQSVTPDVTASYAASQDLYIPGAGSKWSIGPILAEHWGLKSQQIGADVGKISATLQAGGLVITAGQGPEPFTSGGHFIVIRAVTADGKFKVGDSGHNNTSNQEWTPDQLISNMASGSVYAITQ